MWCTNMIPTQRETITRLTKAQLCVYLKTALYITMLLLDDNERGQDAQKTCFASQHYLLLFI